MSRIVVTGLVGSPPRPLVKVLVSLLHQILGFFDSYDWNIVCQFRLLSREIKESMENDETLWCFFIRRQLKCDICRRESMVWRNACVSVRNSSPGLAEARRTAVSLCLSRQCWNFKYSTRVLVNNGGKLRVRANKLLNSFIGLEHGVLLSSCVGSSVPCFHAHADDPYSPTHFVSQQIAPFNYQWSKIFPNILRTQYKKFGVAISYVVDLFYSCTLSSPTYNESNKFPTSSVVEPKIIEILNSSENHVSWYTTIVRSRGNGTNRLCLCCYILTPNKMFARVVGVVFLRKSLEEDIRVLFKGW